VDGSRALPRATTGCHQPPRRESDGHSLCAELLPEIVSLDDWGYPMVGRDAVPAELGPPSLSARFGSARLFALRLRPVGARPLGNPVVRRTVRPGSGRLWADAHEILLGCIHRVVVVEAWLCVPLLLVMYVAVPTVQQGVRVWLPIYWLLILWFLLARTKTVSWRLVATVFALSVPWSFAIARHSHAPARSVRPLAIHARHRRPTRGSRMTGDCHVRFCESRGLRCPRLLT